MTRSSPIIAAAALFGCAIQAFPALAADAAAVAEQWRLRQPIAAEAAPADVDVVAFRRAFIAALQPQLGSRVGYKVGLFSAAARKAFGIAEPRLGELYENMLLADGASVAADFGVGGVWESDLLLVVGDAAINEARSRQAIYDGLRGFSPFIELTSRNFAPDFSPNADQMAALNMGARLGVIGAERALPKGAEGLAQLDALTVEAAVEGGGEAVRDSAAARAALGDLVEVVRFARDAVVREGGRLAPGDIISVGVFTPARAPRVGDRVTVTYRGLGEPATVRVAFRP